MDRFPQPPDPPEEGNCTRCKSWISRDELLIDGCTECDDLLIDDMKNLWAGRPKKKCINQARYHFQLGRAAYVSTVLHPKGIDWRGLI